MGVEDMITALSDLDLKGKYDDTFECGHFIHRDLPYDCSVFYQKFKKILVVSPRDAVIIAKIFRVSPDLIYIFARSFDLASVPPIKNIVRADSPISGWRIKVLEPGVGGSKPLCKVTFYSEVDFKISLFLQKNVGPKSGHLSP
jgi:hypothetical protein